jgi:hypothetical protein
MAEADRCPSGLADACLWMAEGSGVLPVFVLPHAHAVAEHLLAWAEGRPGDWFALCFAERESRYVAALFRNLPGSVERFEAARSRAEVTSAQSGQGRGDGRAWSAL